MATADVRRVVRWGLRHGLFRVSVARGVRAGDLGARMLVEPALIEDPFPAYETLRRQGRLVSNGIVLLAHDHDLCTAVLRSPDFGVVGGPRGRIPGWQAVLERFGAAGPSGPVESPSMLATDPPDHTRLRKLVSRAFNARAVAALRGRTEEIATGLLDSMAAKGGEADLVGDYAALLPATVIAEILGAPVEMREQFLEWGAGAALSLDAGLSYREFRRAEADLLALRGWMTGHFEHVRRHPSDTVLSSLVQTHDAGELTAGELTSMAVLLLAAGFETTVNLIGNGVVQLTGHPDQLAVLRADPTLWPNAVDELLRFDSPVQRTARIAQRDTEVAGMRVPANTIVITVLGAANRDPKVFTDPARLDVARANANEHLAFSNGVHYCLGAGLARMEGEIALRALFDRFPELVLTGPAHRRPMRTLRGYDAIPARLTSPVAA